MDSDWLRDRQGELPHSSDRWCRDRDVSSSAFPYEETEPDLWKHSAERRAGRTNHEASVGVLVFHLIAERGTPEFGCSFIRKTPNNDGPYANELVDLWHTTPIRVNRVGKIVLR